MQAQCEAYQTMSNGIGQGLGVIIGLGGLIAVIFVVIGSINLITSNGDVGKVQKAKKTILSATIGLIITALAFSIVNFVIDATGIGAEEEPTIQSTAEINVSVPVAELKEGESTQIDVSSTSLNAPPFYSYESSDPKVIMVGPTGSVVAVSAGAATVHVGSDNGCDIAEIKFTVNPIIWAESVTISPNYLELNIGKTANLKATVLPDSTDDKRLTWRSSNSSVVSVDQNGNLTAKANGESIVSARTKNNKIGKAKIVVREDKITGGQAIAEAAVELAVTAEPTSDRHFVESAATRTSDNRATKYISARNSVGIGTTDAGGEYGYFYASCDIGVATAVRYSKVDTSFAWNTIIYQGPYLRESSQWRDVGTFHRGYESAGKLQPGDVLIGGGSDSPDDNRHHIFLYVGNENVRKKYSNSTADSYEAGYGDCAWCSYYPHLFNVATDSQNRTNNNGWYRVYRHVNADKKQYDKILK